jgi:hypothetical protein
MHIRRALTLAVAVATLSGAPVLLAQNNQQPNRRDQERRSQQEQRDIQALVQLVDAVSTGKQPAPTDIGLQWEGNHFLRGADGSTYVPFTVAVDRTKLAAPGAGFYVRVVNKNAAAAPAAEQGNRGRNEKPAAVTYPWDNVNFLDVPADGKVSRAMALKPGEYEVFVTIKEKSPLEPQRNQPPSKAGMLRRDLTVPDFNSPDLSISSVLIGNIEQLTAPQLLNASTLPPQFDVAAGHQLPGSLVVPLMSFPVGEYRLEIKVTDKISGKSLTHNAGFTVEA